MAVYLKEFENHTQYENYINGSGAILPNVSICTTEGDVYYNPYVEPIETKLVVYYDIQDISSPTTVCTNYDGSFKSMEIDGDVSVDITTQGNITYQFDSVGEHVIKYELNGLGVGTNAPLFYNLSTVKGVIIPNTFTSIGGNAFNGCSGLTSIDIPSGVTSIGASAFTNCYSLTSIVIPNSVTSIGNSAFDSCSGLTSIVIPSGVTSIGSYAFQGCSSLTNIVYNAQYPIQSAMFNEFRKLETVVIGDSVTSVGTNAFGNCTSLKSVSIGNGVTNILTAAFYYCSSLTSCTIGNSVASIGDSVFYNCTSLTSIDIPNSVTSIGNYAFQNCSDLTSATVRATTPPTLGGNVFVNNASGRKIYVPSASVEAYKAASGWSDYASDIEPIQ